MIRGIEITTTNISAIYILNARGIDQIHLIVLPKIQTSKLKSKHDPVHFDVK